MDALTGRVLMDFEKYKRVHRALHALWSKSGTTHYVKSEWKELEAAIDDLARYGLGVPDFKPCCT